MLDSAGGAAAADANAELSEFKAVDAVARGPVDEETKRRETAALRGHQIAQRGANKVALDFGTPLEIQQDTAQSGEIDAWTIRNNAAREAFFHTAQASLLRQQAEQSRFTSDLLLSGVGGSGLLGKGPQKLSGSRRLAR
jgi:hypothetical protein